MKMSSFISEGRTGSLCQVQLPRGMANLPNPIVTLGAGPYTAVGYRDTVWILAENCVLDTLDLTKSAPENEVSTVSQLTFSPTNEALLLIDTTEGDLHLKNSTTGRDQLKIGPDSGVVDLQFLPDGSAFFVVLQDGAVQVQPVPDQVFPHYDWARILLEKQRLMQEIRREIADELGSNEPF